MTLAAVLDFWFGADRARALRDPARSRLWWRKDPATDTDIRARFATWVTAALAWCRQAFARGDEATLSTAERAFLYMPLEHSEILADQDECVTRLEGLIAESAPADRGALAGMLDYARRHREVIARFDRFPHRNAVLGRASTAAERAFLQTPGARL